MFGILRKSLATGIVTTGYPEAPAATSNYARGRPEIDFAHWQDARPAAAICPTGAIACADADDISPAELASLAHQALDIQVGHIRRAVEKVLAGRSAPSSIVLSGSGDVLGRQAIAGDPALGRIPVVSLADRLGPSLSDAACAYAVAMLAAEG